MTLEPRQERVLRMVLGYLPGIDNLPRFAHRVGLQCRTAFILDSYRSSCVDMYFDVELYASLLDGIGRIFRPDRATAYEEGHRIIDITAPSGARKTLLSAEECKPFSRIDYSCGEATVAVIVSEPWAQVGGPEPYHDSYTFSVYSADDAQGALIAEAQKVCAILGAEIVEIIRAQTRPARRGVFGQLREYLGV